MSAQLARQLETLLTTLISLILLHNDNVSLRFGLC